MLTVVDIRSSWHTCKTTRRWGGESDTLSTVILFVILDPGGGRQRKETDEGCRNYDFYNKVDRKGSENMNKRTQRRCEEKRKQSYSCMMCVHHHSAEYPFLFRKMNGE